MPETAIATPSFPQRTAAIRARCASARPRIRYLQIAEETESGYSDGYLKSVLSDDPKVAHLNLDGVLSEVEAALDRIEQNEESK